MVKCAHIGNGLILTRAAGARIQHSVTVVRFCRATTLTLAWFDAFAKVVCVCVCERARKLCIISSWRFKLFFRPNAMNINLHKQNRNTINQHIPRNVLTHRFWIVVLVFRFFSEGKSGENVHLCSHWYTDGNFRKLSSISLSRTKCALNQMLGILRVISCFAFLWCQLFVVHRRFAFKTLQTGNGQNDNFTVERLSLHKLKWTRTRRANERNEKTPTRNVHKAPKTLQSRWMSMNQSKQQFIEFSAFKWVGKARTSYEVVKRDDHLPNELWPIRNARHFVDVLYVNALFAVRAAMIILFNCGIFALHVNGPSERKDGK